MMDSYNSINAAANAYALSSQANSLKAAEPPRTLVSAGSRLEAVNERLAKSADSLSMICQQIGAMTGLSAGGDPKVAPTPIGAVHRLNDLADEANAKISVIESYIASLQRALG